LDWPSICFEGILYTGITLDIARRLLEDNSGKSKFTKRNTTLEHYTGKLKIKKLIPEKSKTCHLSGHICRIFLLEIPVNNPVVILIHPYQGVIQFRRNIGVVPLQMMDKFA
jgi:hypothetical protein